MKIYFAGSIRGGRADKEKYLELIRHLQLYGEVLTEHIADQKLTAYGESLTKDEYIFKRDLGWINEADIFIAEVSQPSLGVGYEIVIAQSLGKKILCLYKPQEGKRLSAMITGNKGLTVKQYAALPEAFGILDEFFANQ
jgi:hypothetical protein